MQTRGVLRSGKAVGKNQGGQAAVYFRKNGNGDTQIDLGQCYSTVTAWGRMYLSNSGVVVSEGSEAGTGDGRWCSDAPRRAWLTFWAMSAGGRGVGLAVAAVLNTRRVVESPRPQGAGEGFGLKERCCGQERSHGRGGLQEEAAAADKYTREAADQASTPSWD
jgi:hypothetical protein